MNKIQKILKFAMRMEKDAGDFYNYYMDKVQDENLKELFEELSQIEKRHFNILKKKYDELSFTDSPISISWVVDDTFSTKDPHILADSSELIPNQQNATSDLMVIRMAYLMENDFAEFYKNAVNIVDDKKAKEFLTTLSKWETEHRDMFYKRYQKVLKEYWNDISSIVFQ